MHTPPYIARQVDGATFELLPDGSLLIHQARGETITLPPVVAYGVYLFLMTPGTRPALRALDDARQRQVYQQRYGA